MTADLPPLFAGLLVGGLATRMGRPKATLPLGASTLIDRVHHAVCDQVEKCVLLGGGPAPSSLNSLPRIPDVPGLRGPLAGILAALRDRPEAAWLIAACDMPLVNRDAVAWLRNQRAAGRAAVLPRVNGQLEPLLAIYEPPARELLERALAGGSTSPRTIASYPGVYVAVPPEPLARCWLNVNTPAEAASAAQMLDKDAAR